MAKIEIKVVIDLSNVAQTAAMNNLIKSLSTEQSEMGVQSPATEEAKPEPAPKRTRSTKTTPAPKEEAKPEPAPETSEEESTGEAETQSEVTIKDVREALSEKVDQHRAAIKTKLTSFGASNVTSLDPSHYGEMLNFLKALKNG